MPGVENDLRDFGRGVEGDEAIKQQIPFAQEPLSISAVHDAVIGHGSVFSGPYGEKHLLYADWAASGRALASIENHILREVLPLYANTHTTTSVTGLQSTCFRLEARQVIAQAFNARVHYSDRLNYILHAVGHVPRFHPRLTNHPISTLFVSNCIIEGPRDAAGGSSKGIAYMKQQALGQSPNQYIPV
eukprot:7333179-Pyramimonas_sp.AAC.1